MIQPFNQGEELKRKRRKKSNSIMPEDKINQTLGELRIGVELLKKDVAISEKIADQNTQAASALSIIVSDISKIISIHSLKMDTQNDHTEEISRGLDANRVALINHGIEMSKNLERTEKKLIDAIELHSNRTKKDNEDMDIRVKALEKSKILFGTIGTGIVFFVVYIGSLLDAWKGFFSK